MNFWFSLNYTFASTTKQYEYLLFYLLVKGKLISHTWSFAKELTVVDTVVAKTGGVAKTSITKMSSSVGSGVEGSNRSVGIGIVKSSIDLTDGVCLRVSFSLTLAIVVTSISGVGRSSIGGGGVGGRDSNMGRDSRDSSHRRDGIRGAYSRDCNRGRVVGSSNDSNIVGMSCSISIDSWESSMNLSNGVGISISFSLTLAIVVSISSIGRVGRGSIGMGSIGSRDVGSDRGRYSIRGSNRGRVSMVGIGNATVANGTISTYNTIAVVHTSDDSTAG